jgi:stage V sporulation protein G
MEITEVRIKLTADSDDRLQAFCSITFNDSFVVRDLKIIEGTNGPFVAMPSRKLTSHCQRCGSKNHLRANYCNQCGAKSGGDRGGGRDHDGRAKLYADIAHPINSDCREMIQDRVIDEYRKEQDRAKEPGYVSRYEDDYDEVFVDDYVEVASAPQEATAAPQEAAAERTTEIQPGEPGPRAPHAAASPDKTEAGQTPHSGKQRTRGGFGAGILDD